MTKQEWMPINPCTNCTDCDDGHYKPTCKRLIDYNSQSSAQEKLLEYLSKDTKNIICGGCGHLVNSGISIIKIQNMLKQLVGKHG